MELIGRSRIAARTPGRKVTWNVRWELEGDALRHFGSVDPEFLELVPQRAEGDAQGGGRLGLVVAGFLEGLFDRLALDVFDVGGEGGRGVGR